MQVADGKLQIVTEGKHPKFVEAVEQITFNGALAAAQAGKTVLYVTERCVFRLTPEGLELVEVAPGIDVARDILAHMRFPPIVREPKTMDARIFGVDPMGLEDTLLLMDFAERLSYDAERNTVFLNLEGHSIRSRDDVDRMHNVLDVYYRPLAPGFSVVVNYDNFRLDDRLAERYFGMIREPRRAVRVHCDPLYDERVPADQARRRVVAARHGAARVRDAGRGADATPRRTAQSEAFDLRRSEA